jgi:hypothetical protein
MVEIAQHARDDQGPGLTVLAQVGQLVLPVRGKRHDRHDAGPQAALGEHDERPDVRQLDHDPVAAPQPEVVGELAGQRIRAGGQRGVADPGGPVDQGRRVAPGVGDRDDLGAERLSSPPSRLGVSPGQVGRPGNRPVRDRSRHLVPHQVGPAGQHLGAGHVLPRRPVRYKLRYEQGHGAVLQPGGLADQPPGQLGTRADRELARLPGREALRRQVELVASYRTLPFRDPDLPASLLPERWPGRQAHAMFIAAHDALHGPAAAYVREVVGAGAAGI